MNLNADFSRTVVQTAAEANWVPSPLPGVTRRMLDRVGDEIARATSVVRYAQGSQFTAHRHGGGEEFLVLDGVFSDEHGDYPAGHYLRNPPGTAHTPHSRPGCVLFVKLWQFAADDLEPVHVDTAAAAGWQASGVTGVDVLELHAHRSVRTRLLRCTPAAVIPDLSDPGGAELYVLAGALVQGGLTHAQDTWLRFAPQAAPALRAGSQGARVYLKTGAIGADFLQPR